MIKQLRSGKAVSEDFFQFFICKFEKRRSMRFSFEFFLFLEPQLKAMIVFFFVQEYFHNLQKNNFFHDVLVMEQLISLFIWKNSIEGVINF